MITRCLTCLLLGAIAPGAAVSQVTTAPLATLAMRDASDPGPTSPRRPAGREVDQRIDIPASEAGSVVTVAVVVPQDRAPKAGGAARYRVEPAPGVRVFGALAGPLAWTGEGEPLLPVTFTLSRDAPAGPLIAAWVTVEWSDGTRWITALETSVTPVRRLRLAVQAVPALVEAGDMVELRYQLSNMGNAVDTVVVSADPGVGWQALDRERIHVVAVGEMTSGQLRVQVPRSAPLGERRILRAFAVGRGSRVQAVAEVLVGSTGRGSLRESELPLTVFLGAATPEAGGFALNPVGIAVQGQGEVSPGTHLWLAYRNAPQALLGPTLSSRLGGPRLQLGIRRPTWNASAGDLLVETTPLAGYYLGGRGAQLGWTGGGFEASAFLARPTGYDAEPLPGHVAYARAGFRGRYGELGGVLLDRERPRLIHGAPDRRDQMAALRYQAEGGAQRLSLEAGVMRRTEQGRVLTGPVGEARYSYLAERFTLTSEVRTVPRGISGDGAGESHGLLSASVLLTRGLRAVASLFSAPGHSGGPFIPAARRSRGTTAGVHWAGRGWGLDLRGNVTEAETPFWGRMERRTVSALGSVPLGSAVVAQVGMDVGQGVIRDSAYPVHALRTGVRWSTMRSQGWLQANYAPEYAPLSPLQVDFGGAVHRDRVGVQWGTSVRLPTDNWRESSHLWGSAELELTRRLSLVVGTQYQPWFPGAPWRFSVGVGRRVNLPLPNLRQPAVQGVVFEDRNANGQRDPGEPGVSGIALRTDRVVATTDATGRFTVWETVDPALPLRVDPASLEMGMVLQRSGDLPVRGSVAVPVTRTGKLELQLVLPAGSNRTEGVEPAPGTLVHLIDAEGQRRAFVSDSAGRVSVGALRPGRYELVVHRPPRPGAAVDPKRVEVEIPAGETVQETVVVPYKPREIRFGTAPDSLRTAQPLQ